MLSSPVSLSSAGDFVTLQFTFTNANLLGSATSSLSFGLYNSHGVNPRSDLSSSGLTATESNPLASDGTVTWEGYVTRYLGTGTPSIFTRADQSADTATENQDLLFANVGGGAYDNPSGSNVGTAASSTITLAASGVYTVSYTITLNGTGGLDFTSSLYDGADTSGAVLSAVTGTTATPLTTSFDSLAIGFRETANITGANPLMTITAVSLSVNAVPEPSAFAALAGAAGLAFAASRRRRRSA